jgi:hypothetical protein
MLDVGPNPEPGRREALARRFRPDGAQAAIIVHIGRDQAAEFQETGFQAHLSESDIAVDAF